jgi:hypothetical protein
MVSNHLIPQPSLILCTYELLEESHLLSELLSELELELLSELEESESLSQLLQRSAS